MRIPLYFIRLDELVEISVDWSFNLNLFHIRPYGCLMDLWIHPVVISCFLVHILNKCIQPLGEFLNLLPYSWIKGHCGYKSQVSLEFFLFTKPVSFSEFQRLMPYKRLRKVQVSFNSRFACTEDRFCKMLIISVFCHSCCI